MTDQPTEVLPDPAPPAAPRRARRRVRRAVFSTLIALVVLVVLVVVADIATRAYTEQRVAQEVQKSLPAEVKADVSAHIGGFSVLQQFLAGSFQRVELDAPHATVKGAPFSAKIVATGVPIDMGKPVTSATGSLDFSQSSLNKVVTIPGASGDITLGSGTIGYDGHIDLLGFPVGYTVTAKPQAEGKTVLLQPEKASLSTGSGDVNLTRLLQTITNHGPYPVCAAQYLPDGVLVNDIGVTNGQARVTLTAERFVLGPAFLDSKGSCS